MMNSQQSPPLQTTLPWPGTIRCVQFDKQPPPTVRKSNFFSFTVQLHDGGGQRLRVRTAKFIDFLTVDWPAPPMSETSEQSTRPRPSSRRNSRTVKQENARMHDHPAAAFSSVPSVQAGTPVTGDGPPPGLFSQHSGYADPSTAAASNAGNGKQLQNGASPPTAATPVTANHAVFLPPKSNGIEYEVELEHPHGRIVRERLYLCLVDNRNFEVVHYEGQDRNPEMRRVLLTHEVTCSRCSNNATGCGNKTAAPSDPTIHKENGECSLIFYVKCNQNCLRTPGSPKQGRRFKLMLSTGQNSTEAQNHQLGISEEIFVHNNSKHGRPVVAKQSPSSNAVADSTCGASQAGSNTGTGEHSPDANVPSIALVWPKEGWTSGGQRVAIIGENFTKTMQVVFGHHHLEAEMYNSRILLVNTPSVIQEGKVEITLMQRQGNKVKQSCTTQPGHFHYVEPAPNMECVTDRLRAALSLPIHTVVTTEDIFSLLNERLTTPGVCMHCQTPTNLPPEPRWPAPRATKRSHSQLTSHHSVSSDALSPSKCRPAPLVIPDSATNHLGPEQPDFPPMLSTSNASGMPSTHSWARPSSFRSSDHLQSGRASSMSAQASGQASFFGADPTYSESTGGGGGGGGGCNCSGAICCCCI
eukprot:scpid62211/ scgid0196/ Transcription factor collier; Transcription factor knot